MPRKRLVLPIIGFALAVLAGCGSRSSAVVPPPGGGFSNSNLKGTYVFSFGGNDAAAVFTIAGTFTADGNGGIASGTIDINQLYSSPVQVTVGGNSR